MRVALVLAGLYAVLLLHLRGCGPREPPRVGRAFHALGPLRAGAAVVGESQRMWFGPDLLDALRAGFAVALRAIG